MAVGITMTRNQNGTIKSVTFNWKKYGDKLQDFLRSEGIDAELYEEPTPRLRKSIQAIKTEKAKEYSNLDDMFRSQGLI